MIIVLFFVALIGFAVYRKMSEDEGFYPALAGGSGIVICLLVIFINNYIGGGSNVVAYYQDKAQIEAAISNPHITATERNAAIELAVRDNTIITTAKRWYKDPFIGWFRQAAIVDLPLFDISKIPSCQTAQ